MPAHSFVLLHWFANIIELNNYDAIELPFNPNNRDHGTHLYRNDEQIPGATAPREVLHPRQPQQPGKEILPCARVTTLLNNTSAPRRGLWNWTRAASYSACRTATPSTGCTSHSTSHSMTSRRPRTTWSTSHTTTSRRPCTTRSTPTRSASTSWGSSENSPWTSVTGCQPSEIAFGHGIGDLQLNSLRNTWGELACLGLLMLILTGTINLNFPQHNPFDFPSGLQGSAFSNCNDTLTYRYNNQANYHNTENTCLKATCIIMTIIIIIIIIIFTVKKGIPKLF